jgi:hypothetical protein
MPLGLPLSLRASEWDRVEGRASWLPRQDLSANSRTGFDGQQVFRVPMGAPVPSAVVSCGCAAGLASHAKPGGLAAWVCGTRGTPAHDCLRRCDARDFPIPFPISVMGSADEGGARPCGHTAAGSQAALTDLGEPPPASEERMRPPVVRRCAIRSWPGDRDTDLDQRSACARRGCSARAADDHGPTTSLRDRSRRRLREPPRVNPDRSGFWGQNPGFSGSFWGATTAT